MRPPPRRLELENYKIQKKERDQERGAAFSCSFVDTPHIAYLRSFVNASALLSGTFAVRPPLATQVQGAQLKTFEGIW